MVLQESESEVEQETESIKKKKEKPINVTVNNITQPTNLQPQINKRFIGRSNLPIGFV